MLLHELFERRARDCGAATALVAGGQTATYADLEARANRLARLLRRRGVTRGSRVGLWLPRSPNLYTGLLAILKAGAAYVPMDAGCPIERVEFMLQDSQAALFITTRRLAAQLNGGQALCLDDPEVESELAAESPKALTAAETGLTPQDLCYIIYTSGTTGRPKGVQIEHRSAAHLVRTEAELFGVRPDDRVYQGFSVAFDASVEEIWLAFHAGATLVAATPEMERAGADLSPLLTQAGVTVLSCVPTLLLMLDKDIPTVRLLILGGEACPPELIERWWRPNRRVFNTYGPTEATVIATCAECRPGRAVTIGKPMPGYSVAIVDENMRVLPEGVPGQLCIGGLGLARGYLGRDDLTREKFVANPFKNGSGGGLENCPVLYKTGDLARWTSDGEIQFLGRLDDQVKIRGFRVELSEIEAALLEFPGVQAAAVAVRTDSPGVQQLVGYIVPRAGNGGLDEAQLRSTLGRRLPGYMLPALLERVSELPRLPSGKVDRKRLPPPTPRVACAAQPSLAAATPLQKQIAATWQRLFGHASVSVTDDFFLDLGGHSLLAARMVSELRQKPAFARLSMADVYRCPTIAALAGNFEKPAAPSETEATTPGIPLLQTMTAGQGRAEGKDEARVRATISPLAHFCCGLAQLVCLPLVLSFFALQWLGPYLVYTVLVEEGFDILPALAGACLSLMLVYPLMLAVAVLAKWILIGRYHAGQYRLWGLFYFRWWLFGMIEAAVPVDYLAGTPLLNIYLRLMGAKIGANAHLATSNFAIYDLLSIGADTSINVDSNLLGYTVEDGWLKLGTITIGRDCFVGARSALGENTRMEDGSALEDLSLLPRGCQIAAGQTWRGSPARRVSGPVDGEATNTTSADSSNHQSRSTSPLPANSETRAAGHARVGAASRFGRFGLCVLYAVSLLIIPVLVASALFPGIVMMNQLNYRDPYYWYLSLAPLVGLSFVALLALEIAAAKWLLLGRVRAGRYPLHSGFHWRKWFVDKMLELSLDVLGPLYASIYLKPWYALLGARMGPGAEVSTASFITPDLLVIGEESFIADSVSLGAPRVSKGWMSLGRNHIGRRAFVGNSAMLPPGTVLGDNVLIGCLSAPPDNPLDALRPDTTWLGSPAIFLPQRQPPGAYSEETTYNPPSRLRAQRALIEFVRVITPSTCFIILISLMFSALLLLDDNLSMGQSLLLFPFLYLACGLAATGFTIACKWLLVGRYRPGERPLWSTFVWRNELLNALHEHLAEPFLVDALSGTPFICWYFRLLGARIGRRVYMETTDLSEFDLAHIGDEAELNADCTIQTHLFEDRVMKMGKIELGARCRVGAGSLVLYDTRLEPDSSLGELSLLMKGEVLPAESRWEGVPARALHT